MSPVSSQRSKLIAKSSFIGVVVFISSVAMGSTTYDGFFTSSITVVDPPIQQLFGFVTVGGTGNFVPTQSGTGNSTGNGAPSMTGNSVNSVTNVLGTTAAPSGYAAGDASTTGYINLGNLSGSNAVFPVKQPLTIHLRLDWSYTLTVSCTDADESASAWVTDSIPGSNLSPFAPTPLLQIGAGTQTFSDSGFQDFLVTVPGNSTKQVYLNADVNGYGNTPAATPEPATYAVFGLGLCGLFLRRKRS